MTALIFSGIPPALGIVIGAVVDRRLDVIGVLVLAGLAVGTVAGLVSHSARLYLLEGAVPSVVFALACLGSLRTAKPLIYRLAVEVLGPRSARGRQVAGAWRYPASGAHSGSSPRSGASATSSKSRSRLIVVEITSTGIALLFSKLVPYAFAVCLSAWTLAYGEHEKQKAEQLAAAAAPRRGPGDPGGRGCRAVSRGADTLVRCAAR